MHYTICDYLTDLVQNSVEAKASVIIVEFNNVLNEVEVMVSDNGKGMDEQSLAKAQDPFYSEPGKHDRRKIGLGLPFIIQAMQTLSGEFDIKSDPEMGTSIRFKYNSDHIDAPEPGDIEQLLVVVFSMEGDQEIIFKRTVGAKSYQITRSELLSAVGSESSVAALQLMKKYFRGLEENIYSCMCKV